MVDGVGQHFMKCPVVMARPSGLTDRRPVRKMLRRLTTAERLLLLSEEFGWRCGICGEPLGDLTLCNIDHIVPKSRGGRGGWTNLQPAHITCNIAKRDNLMRPKVWPKRIALS